MRNIFWITLVFVFFSCKSTKETTELRTIKPEKISVISPSQKRNFDYFFFEGQRYKMQGDSEKAKMCFVECLKIDSLSSTCYFELANIEISKTNYKVAQGLLEKAVAINTNNKWYKMLLGDLYQENKDIGGAISIYKSLVDQYPNNDEYIYILAQLYAQNKQWDSAIDAYNMLEKNIGINEAISLEKEKLYLQLGKKSLAYKEIELLIKDNPYEPRYYGFLGDVYAFNKELDKAEQSYLKILDIDPNNGLGYFSLSNIYLQKQDTTQFFNYFLKGVADKDLNIEVKIQRMLPFLMGKDFINKKDTNEIFTVFDKLIEVHANDSRSHIYYANYLQNNQKYEKALAQYKLGLNVDNSSSAVWQDMFLLELNMGKFDLLLQDTNEALLFFPDEALFNLFNGLAYMQIEDNSKAYQSLSHGLQFVGDNEKLKGQFYSYLGDVQYSLDMVQEAFFSYDQALLIDEHNIAVLNNYSYYLSLENLNLDKAESMIAKCIELEPGNATYLDTYAWVLFKKGRYFEAKYIIERAIDNGGTESKEIVEHYGDILYNNGDVDGALIQWQKALDFGIDTDLLQKKIDLKRYVEE
jgi:tetratricopeptide (TPR) repeat protein